MKKFLVGILCVLLCAPLSAAPTEAVEVTPSVTLADRVLLKGFATGANTMVVSSGGALTISSGSTLTIAAGSTVIGVLPLANLDTGTANISVSGNAATVTTNANLTGIVTSVGNATSIADGAIAIAKLATNPLARANHTGTQLLATISDAGTMAAQGAGAVAITGGTMTGVTISGLLPFDGVTSSFPALKRSTTKLIARLADDSANTNLEVLDQAYDATSWNANNDVPTKNAVRDKIEAMSVGGITGLDTRVIFFDGDDTPAGDGGLTYNKTSDVLTAVGGFSGPHNGTVGVGTPNTGAFTTLSASGALTLGTSGILVGGTNLVEQRNAANAQTFNLYNTTDGTNKEYLSVFFSSNEAWLMTAEEGTGTVRPLQIGTSGAARIRFRTNGTSQWEIDGTDGHLLAVTDNAKDIGASGATRPRTGYFGTSLISPLFQVAAGTQLSNQTLALGGVSQIVGNVGSGILTITNAAGNDFSLLQFGGVTSSFPALKRSTTRLIARLADDSANTNLEVLDDAYDATGWNGNNDVPTKNAVRDKIESHVGEPFEWATSVNGETEDLTTGTNKMRFRMPVGMTLTEVRISANDAPTGASIIVDVKESNVSVFSTLVSIDADEKTSTTATTPAVISDSTLADDAEIAIDVTQIGSTLPGKGIKILLKGTRN